jgi:hypothetical protein
MNSPPMVGTTDMLATKMATITATVQAGWRRHQRRRPAYTALIHSKTRVLASRAPRLNQ